VVWIFRIITKEINLWREKACLFGAIRPGGMVTAKARVSGNGDAGGNLGVFRQLSPQMERIG